VHISGPADEVTGAVLATAIDAAGHLVPGDRRTAAQRRLDALGNLTRRYLACPDIAMSGGGHPHVIVTLDADTLRDPHRLHPHGEGSPDEAAGADAAAWAGRAGGNVGAGGGPGGTLSWVGPIAGCTARRIACDADVTMVLIDPHGRAVVEQTRRRFFTPPNTAR
jgi:uncharacterized protein DUF222